MRRRLNVPLVPELIVTFQSVEQFVYGYTLLLWANERAAAMLLGSKFAQPVHEESLCFMAGILAVYRNLLARADMPSNFPNFLAVGVVGNVPAGTKLALKDSALSVSVHFAFFLRG